MKTLKLKHTLKIQEDGATIKGQITDVIWNDNERGDEYKIESNKIDFYICSEGEPELTSYSLYIRGNHRALDSQKINHRYDSPEKAKKVMNFIMEYTVKEEEEKRVPKEGEEVRIDKAKTEKRIYIYTVPGKSIGSYIVVMDSYKNAYKNGEEYDWDCYPDIYQIKEEEKERKLIMTDKEREEAKKILKLK